MTDLNEVELLESDDFLLEKMREANITADRKQCHVVLAALLVSRHQSAKGWKATLKSLCELLNNGGMQISEPECQELLDQLVESNFAEKFGQFYFPENDLVVAWENRLREIAFES